MKHFIVTLLVGFWLLGPHAFADVNAKNGISITTASTINGKTPNSAFNGLTIVSGGGASFSDNFNRSDRFPITPDWTNGFSGWGDFGINTNRAQGGGINSLAAVAVSTVTFAANQSAQATLVAGTVDFCGPVVRVQSDGSCYAASSIGGGQMRIYKFTGSTPTTPFSDFTATGVAGDTLTITASSTGTVTLELFHNGVSLGTRNDSSSPYNSGQPGMWAGASILLEDFVAVDL